MTTSVLQPTFIQQGLRPHRWLLSLTLLVFTTLLANAQTRYVTPTGAGTRTGDSWTNALSGTALQGTLATAPAGTTVLVAGGLYKPTTTTDRTVSFSIASGVQVYGGYTAGTNTRTTDPSSTTFSGDIGTVGDNTDNSGHVVDFRNVSEQTRLDGVLITGGVADASLPGSGFFRRRGGGIRNESNGSGQRSNPVIANCQITRNTSDLGGGGMYNQSRNGSTTSPTLINCSFTNNSAEFRDGGGMLNTTDGDGETAGAATSPNLINCRFVNNTSSYGAGMFNEVRGGVCSPTLTNCVFMGNVANIDGGGMNNEAEGAGGGTGTCSPVLLNCTFMANISNGDQGGGMHNYARGAGNVCSPVLTNCLFAGNQAIQGAGLYNQAGDGTCRPLLTNCTIVNNAAITQSYQVSQGGAIYNRRFDGGAGVSQSDLINCIIWGNTAAEAPGVFNEEGTSTTYRFTNSQDGVQPGPGNRSVDPLFVDAAQDNFQLQPCSPLVDAGDNSANTSMTDLAGNARKVRTIDLGAFERQGDLPTATLASSGPLTCTQTSVTLTASGGDSYAFRGPGGPLTSSGNTATVSQPGTYTVTATNGVCSLSATTTVTSNTTAPTASLSSSDFLTCARPTVTLTAGGGGTYLFSAGATQIGGSGANTATVSQAGVYSVTVIGANGCSATASTTVTGTPALSAAISGSLSVCGGNTTNLTATGGTAFRWSTGATTPTISATAGVYSVTVTEGGCSGVASATVTTSAPPPLSVNPSATAICGGQSATLSATPGLSSYRWSTGQTTPSISVTAAGTYSVTATTTGGCSATASARLTVNPRPAAPYATPIVRKLYTTDFPIPLFLYALPTGFGLDLRFYNGATNAPINPPFVRPNQPGVFAYYATQTDSKGCVSLPTPFSLTVLEGGTLVSKPADRTVCQNASTVLSVTATGSDLKYTWYESSLETPLVVVEVGSDTQGGKMASLTVSKVQRTKLYHCLVTGQFGVAVAGPIKVTLNPNCQAQARLGADESEQTLSVRVLGNPVVGEMAEIEVLGASGQPLQVRLVDSQGRLITSQQRASAQAAERFSLTVGNQAAGLLLLQVSTPRQSQTVKVLKAD